MNEGDRLPREEDFPGSGQTVSVLHTRDLKPLADQLMMIAKHLREADLDPAKGRPADQGQPAHSSETLAQKRTAYAEMARKAYATRRRRAVIFGNPELFGEPAWDILLDLYVAHVQDKRVSVSSACIGSASPPTTGLRWLGVLAENGLIVREQDADDQRRVLVRLTGHGAKVMDEYFASVREA